MSPSLRHSVLAVLVLVSGLLAALPAAHAAAPVVLTVDPQAQHGPVNGDLIGFGWHGGVPLRAVEPLRPRLVRVDASLQDVSPAAGQLRLAPLLEKVAAVRAAGAEPLVILSYTPAWLGAPNAAGRDATRVAPADLDAWERLVHDVVAALATAPSPALRFEAWNEPDVPLFWQDTLPAWLDTVTRSARAVASVERETGLDLAFGGPATAFPDPLWLQPFLGRFRDPSLPLDFVSWHYYGNYPFLGPDGAEFDLVAPIQPIVGQRNPLATPSIYGAQIDAMRRWVDAGLAGSARPRPPLLLDEWNLSAGGFDRRHDTHEGAAFAAATLIEMQAAGLDGAAFFRAGDTRPPDTGDHGTVRADGRRKPVWWTFRLWGRLLPQRVALQGARPEQGLWALASTRPGARRVTVLAASFSASSPRARRLTIGVDGARVTRATVRRVDARHDAARHVARARVAGGTARVALPAQAVALVDLRLEPAPPPAGAPGIRGYDGRNPFRCELQQVGKGVDFPQPDADPFCVEYDKTAQNVDRLGIVDFLAKEPARVAAAGDKCFYYQTDHWRSQVVEGDEATETYNFDGSYFFDRARGVAGAYAENLTFNNQSFDPTTLPGFPDEYEPYFGEGRGGMQGGRIPADPRCVELAREKDVYAPEP